MKTEEIVFFILLAVPVIVFVIILVSLLKEFNKQLKEAEKQGEEVKKKQGINTDKANQKP